ncbi:MAG: hypothetical protein IJK93_07690 [Muribaculaceae bacterium]|nr:hypothetical protein [Muribaculaceae bacterium]
MGDKEKMIKDNILSFIKSIDWVATAVAVIITIIISILWNVSFNYFNSFWNTVITAFLKYILTFILLVIIVHQPRFLIKKIGKIIQDNDNYLKKIDKCPRMTAFYTDGNFLKDKIDSMAHLEPNQRWQFSMFITQLLTNQFKDFSIKIKIIDYSGFSKEIMKECKSSVYLTGSMRPSSWLNALADNNKNDVKYKFFNNLLPSDQQFPINENNHSVYINKCQTLERLRVVCLTPEDMNFLFISENSVHEYFRINSTKGGIKTYFTEWESHAGKMDEDALMNVRFPFNSNDMQPLVYEYALYDGALLFKFKKVNKIWGELTVINGKWPHESESNKKEFKAVQDFFNYFKDNTNSSKKDYMSIISDVQKNKIDMLKMIINNRILPHKYSYLYSGADKWDEFIKKGGTRYGNRSTLAIVEFLNHFFKSDTNLDIVEIGAGNGNRIAAVCDALGTDDIKQYRLVDISNQLLEESLQLLLNRLGKDKIVEPLLLDCCSSEKHEELEETINNKTVLILSNSTLFTEVEFNWESFKAAHQIFISLDLYDDNNSTYSDLSKAVSLFLFPLKVFEIPIIDELIEPLSNYLFQQKYDTDKNCFNIYFNLKIYLEILRGKTSNDKAVSSSEIAEKMTSDIEERKNISKIIDSVWNASNLLKTTDLLYNAPVELQSRDYISLRKKLLDIDKLTVLSCLKFKKEKEDAHIIRSIRTFFEKKGFNANVKVAKDRDFVGVKLTKRT